MEQLRRIALVLAVILLVKIAIRCATARPLDRGKIPKHENIAG